MDMKRHMLIFFKNIHVNGWEKEWGCYKIEVIIRKGGRALLLWKLIGKGSNYEVVRLKNEVLIF